MKKLLLGSIILSLFCITLLLVQISCTKKTIAQTSAPVQVVQQNKILITTNIGTPPHDSTEILICNYDGSEPGGIVSDQFLPSTSRIIGGAKMSPDGKHVFFVVKDVNNNYFLYKSDRATENNSLTPGKKITNLSMYSDVTDIQISGAY